MGEEEDLPAGGFSTWVDETLAGRGVDVPCGGCTACCRSSYFIHVGPDERRTLRRIPRALLVPAPGRPGQLVMGYDERGHCPMLVDDACSIYEDRPLTCRRYDCRVFAAADLSPDDDAKPEIAERVRRWRFDHPTTRDETARAAVRAAVRFLRDHPDAFADGGAPRTAGELALRAVEAHEAFLTSDPPDVATVRVVLRRRATS